MPEYKALSPMPDGCQEPLEYLGSDYYCYPLTATIYNCLIWLKSYNST